MMHLTHFIYGIEHMTEKEGNILFNGARIPLGGLFLILASAPQLD